MSNTFGQIGDSGELEKYPDTYASVTPEDVQAAMTTEGQIIEENQKVARSFIKMAYLLDMFESSKLYLARGFPNLTSWLGSPEINISYRVARDLLRIKRELIPTLGENLPNGELDAIALLSQVGISKARAVLPLMKKGDPDAVLEMVQDASNQTFRDIKDTVKEVVTGKEIEVGKKQPVRFFARARRNDTFTTIKVTADNGVGFEDCGTLTIRNDYVDQVTRWFGENLSFEE